MNKPTRIISPKLHKEFLEDMRVLSEEAAVGLGKHQVHGLLGKVYKLSEELCTDTERSNVMKPLFTFYYDTLQLYFCVGGPSPPLRVTRLSACRDMGSCTAVNNSAYAIKNLPSRLISSLPLLKHLYMTQTLYKHMRVF